MLIPRFSLRTILLLLTVCAFFFLVMGRAYRGDPWAVVVTVAVISIFITLAVQAVFYAVVVAFGRIVGAKIAPARTSQGGIQSSNDVLMSTELDENRNMALSDGTTSGGTTKSTS